MAVTLDEQTAAAIGPLRVSSGVVTLARTGNLRGTDIDLQAGDVIHAINGTSVLSVEDLRQALALLKGGDAAALLVERAGRLSYVTFEIP